MILIYVVSANLQSFLKNGVTPFSEKEDVKAFSDMKKAWNSVFLIPHLIFLDKGPPTLGYYLFDFFYVM